jgi:hypothetical protein
MSQTYPQPITAAMVALIDDGTARTNPTPTYPTLATTTVAYTPKVWSEKAANHPAGDPDFTNVTLIAKSSNMPYP